MTLLQSWIDSLQLLKPKNLKLFVLVTIKSIGEMYTLYFRYFWWAIGLMVICFILPFFCVRTELVLDSITVSKMPLEAFKRWINSNVYTWSFCLHEFLILAACFCTRPSITQKDASYFCKMFKKTILYCIVLLLIFRIQTLATPWHVLLILFFADSEGGPKNFFLSMWYALKMIICNAPLFLIINLFNFLRILIQNKTQFSYWLYENILSSIPGYPPEILFRNIISALVLPILVCIFANIYIKKRHDQFELYFKK